MTTGNMAELVAPLDAPPAIDRRGRADRLIIYVPASTQDGGAEAFARRAAAATERSSVQDCRTSVIPGEGIEGANNCYQVRCTYGGAPIGAGPVTGGTGSSPASNPLMDVIEFDYRDSMFNRSNTGTRAYRLLTALLATLPLVARWPVVLTKSICSNKKAREEKGKGNGQLDNTGRTRRDHRPADLPVIPKSPIQLLLALLLILVMSLYVVLLLVAVLTLIPPLLGQNSEWGRVLQGVVVGLTAALAVIPVNIRRATENLGDRWSLILDYLGGGDHREVIIGKFDELLKRASEAGYKSIIIVGYSIGSVVALDTLFPPTPTPQTVPAQIDALVTIGCPHDTICCFYPQYFTRRSARPDVPGIWVNVFNPVDSLSSNFRPDTAIYHDAVAAAVPHCHLSTTRAPEPGNRAAAALPTMSIAGHIPDDNRVWNPLGRNKGPTLIQVITWMGLRSHSMYWNRTFDDDHGCIGDIIDVLLRKPA